MFNPGLHDFHGIQVAIFDHRLYVEQQREAAKEAILQVSACAFAVPAESIEAARMGIYAMGAEHTTQIADNIDLTKPVIFIEHGMQEFMSEEAFMAIMQHERGHIECGHTKTNLELLTTQGKGGISDNLEMEIEADAYSSLRTSSAAMLDGLLKTVQYQSTFHRDPLEFMKAALKDEALKSRCRALTA